MSKKDGSEFRLYYSETALTDNTNAEVAGHAWTEATEVASVDGGNERASNEFKARSGIITTTGAQKLSKSILVAYDTEDDFYTALVAAMKANSEIAIADVDGAVATEGTKGDAGNYKVTSMPRTEPDEGPVTLQVELTLSSQMVPDYVAPAA